MVWRFILPIILSLSLLACRNSNTDKNLTDDFNIPDSILNEDTPQLSSGVIDDMVQNISSAVETAALIKGLKVPFNKDYLANTKYTDNFNTNYSKALALGIYGCDLGYLNMYEKTSLVLEYISSIKTLADGIQVGQFFDFNTLKRLATNNQNLDSLIYLSQQNFNKIDSYLRETNRANLSVVIVAGVWVEGLYLSTRVSQDVSSKKINETIGEQKEIINILIPVLNVYKRDPNIAKLITELEVIKKLYENVKITTENGEPEMIEENGVLSFKQNDIQTIDMSDETLKAIINTVQELRNKLIKG